MKIRDSFALMIFSNFLNRKKVGLIEQIDLMNEILPKIQSI